MSAPRLRLRLMIGDAMLGPGKADLLDGIRRTGSIAASQSKRAASSM